MKDNFGREIDYMRISITEDCNLNCIYCRQEQPENEKNVTKVMTWGDILEVCRAAVFLGIGHFRITGGEPFMNRDCMEMIRRLKTMPGTKQVGITTNGVLLGPHIAKLKEIGIDSVNVSLDTMSRNTYREITGKDCFDLVLSNIHKAYEAGIPLKINCVPSAAMTGEELSEFLKLIKDREIALRFIEYMPMGGAKNFQGRSEGQVKEMLKNSGILLKRQKECLGKGPAVYYRAEGYRGRLGFIQPLHGKFCASCNRVRLTSEGRLRTCLFYKDSTDLMPALRGGKFELLTELITEAIKKKPEAHRFETECGQSDMSRIGG